MCGNDATNSNCPARKNICADVGSYPTPPANFCAPRPELLQWESFTYSYISNWYQTLGGLGTPDPTNGKYPNPEFSTDSNQVTFKDSDYTCRSRSGGGFFDIPSQYPYDNCTNTGAENCGAPSNPGSSLKIANYGDPLLCCLRDFQCNEGQNNDVNGPSCFSNNDLQATCPSSFRGMDTMPCQYLTTQMCLGNLNDNISGLDSSLPFTSLWVNSVSELATSGTVTLESLSVNTPFKISNLVRYPVMQQPGQPYAQDDKECILDPVTGQPPSDTSINGNCPRSGLIVPPHDGHSIGGTDIQEMFGQLPVCQKIFWRTLYGNQPEFQNVFWKPSDSDLTCPSGAPGSEEACLETSVAPQQAACSATPFGGNPTPTGVEWAQNTLQAVINKVKNGPSKDTILKPINLVEDPDFFSWLFSVCSQYPEVCAPFLTTECANVTQEQLDDNPFIRNWCGCYLPENFYTKYVNNFINQECTPYCNSSSVIPMVQPDNPSVKQVCTQSVCIIDDVAITLAKTEFEGNNGSLNFSQICGSCGTSYENSSTSANISNTQNVQGGSVTTKNGSRSGKIDQAGVSITNTLNNNVASITCQCQIENFSLQSLGGSILGGVNLAQSCGNNSTCFNTQYNPLTDQTETVPVDCNDSGNSISANLQASEKALETKASKTSNYWAMLIIIGTIAIILIIWLFFASRGVPENNIKFSRKIPYNPPKIQNFNNFYRNY